LRKQLSVNDKDTLLITTSRLTDKNAVDDVIRALSKLPEHVIFAVLGTGPDEQMLRELAVTEGVSERVRFVGFVPYEEIPAYLHASDIFVRPSRAEGMGNSFIEAMAAGLPVIATQEGGIVDFLFDAKNDPDKPTTGWAVPKDDPDAIVQAVGDIISHPEQVQKVREHAHVFIAGTYEWDTVAHRMREEVFRDTA
jgi:glycosyltransferase involved in cell wall biosynthesis